MTSIKKIYFLALTVLSIFVSAQSNFFVSSTTGSDSNDGLTWQTAFKTIDKAITLKESTAGNHNVYVAMGSYAMGAHTLGAGVQMNLYGGFPVPNASTVPVNSCTASPVDYITNITSAVTDSNWRLTGSGGGLLINGFHYNGTNTGGLYNGSFITVSGNNNDDAADAKNKVITLENMIIPSYKSSSSGWLYVYNAEDIQININNIYVGGGGYDGSSVGGGGAFLVTRGYSDNAAITTSSKNVDVVVKNSTFSNITSAANIGGSIFYMDQDYNKDLGSSSLTVINSDFCNNKNGQLAGYPGAVISASRMKVLTLTNNRFIGNESTDGGAVTLNNSGNLISSGNVYQNNHAFDRGGVISISGTYPGSAAENLAPSTFTNDKFYNNYSGYNTISGNGGAIYLGNNKAIRLDQDEFSGNYTTGYNGGALYLDTNQMTPITDTKFCNNKSNSDGGAINTTGNGGLTITNGTFTSNTTTGNLSNGGAIRTDGPLNVSNTQFYTNTAKRNGGAIMLEGNYPSTISRAVFHSNTGNEGGAIYKKGGNTLTVQSSFFVKNSATSTTLSSGGGAVYLENTNYISTNNIYDSNTSGSYGGAFFLNSLASSQSLSVSGDKYFSNTADARGGGFYVVNGTAETVSITGSEFGFNKTNQNFGGGVYFQDAGQAGDEIDTFDSNKFYGNSANGSTTAQFADIYLSRTSSFDYTIEMKAKGITNTGLQLLPTFGSSKNYPSDISSDGFKDGGGNFQQTTALTLSYTLPTTISCPIVPTAVCKTLEETILPSAIITTNPSNIDEHYKVVCPATPTNVTILSNSGATPLTFTYTLITRQEGEITTTQTGLIATTSGSNRSVDIAIPTTGIPGTSYQYIINSVSDAVGKVVNYSCDLREATVFVKDCKDSDNDGVSDAQDLDDDNDGILDTVECPNDNAATIGGAYPASFTNLTPSVLGLTTLGATNQNVTKDISNLFGYPANSGAIIITVKNANVDPAKDAFYTIANAPVTTWVVKGSIGSYVGMEHASLYYAHDSRNFKILDGTAIIDRGSTASTGSVWLKSNDAYTYKLVNQSDTNQNGQLHYLNINNGSKYFEVGTSFSDPGELANYTIRILPECDTDKDGIPNRLDLDSDGDGCADAKESGVADLAGVTMQNGNAINGYPNTTSSVTNAVVSGPYGPNGLANSVETSPESGAYKGTYNYGQASNPLVNNCACYNPVTNTATGIDTKHGITALQRAGTNGNWPMIRKSAYTVLEAKTKGFVITRIANPETAIKNPVVGMMVWDTDDNNGVGCLKINTNGTTGGWKCFNNPACP